MARKQHKRNPIERTGQHRSAIQCTALYIRVSTERQAEEGFSLDAQRERLTAFCVAQGWPVDQSCIYIDAGISGKTKERAAFQTMMAAARAGTVTRIVAMKLDRLARNVRDFLGVVDELKAAGCDLVLIKESFDTSTPHGKFALTMFAAMAELEAATITERVMSGKMQKAQEGGYNGAQCPLGYTYAQGVFALVEPAASTVRSIFEMFASGESMAEIARALNNDDIPTARGRQWHTSTVRYVLSNGFYAGIAQWHDTERVGTHPLIIDKDLYEQAHIRLQAIRPGPQPTRA